MTNTLMTGMVFFNTVGEEVGKGEGRGEERMDGSDSGSDELHLGGQVRAKYVYSCGTWPRRVVQKVHCR